MDKGWIKLSRGIKNNMVWQDKPFSKGQAWIDILLSVNHKENTILINGKSQKIKRGQLWTSQVKLAERWGWSRNKVGRFLALLMEQGMVHIDGTPNGTALTVINWGKFQNQRTTDEATDEATDGASDEATDGAQTRMKKNVKEEKEKPAALPSEERQEDDYDPEDDGPWYTGDELLEMSKKGLI